MRVEGGSRNTQELGEKTIRSTLLDISGQSWKNNTSVIIQVIWSADMDLNETLLSESVAEFG